MASAQTPELLERGAVFCFKVEPTMITLNRQSVRGWWREYRAMLSFLALMLVFRASWADWVVVPTGSMNPTIVEGDRVLIDKHAFGMRLPFTHVRLTDGGNPMRGDIVVFGNGSFTGKARHRRTGRRRVPGWGSIDHQWRSRTVLGR